MASRAKEMIVPLCSALEKPHLQYCVQFWGSHHRKVVVFLERVQRRTMKKIQRLKHLSMKAEGTGIVQTGEKKALGKPHCNLPIFKGSL